MSSKRKPAHTDRELKSGQYRKGPQCDACNKPTGTDYGTDDEVCDGGDGPGFFLCDRQRCPGRKWLELDVEARRALYTAVRVARGDE
jgi:hypothetical protein